MGLESFLNALRGRLFEDIYTSRLRLRPGEFPRIDLPSLDDHDPFALLTPDQTPVKPQPHLKPVRLSSENYNHTEERNWQSLRSQQASAMFLKKDRYE